jgi:hypothetical protein
MTENLIQVFSNSTFDFGTYNLNFVATPSNLGASLPVPFVLNMINLCDSVTFFPMKIPSIAAFEQDPDFLAQQSI